MRKKLLQHTLFAAIAAWSIYLAQGTGPADTAVATAQAAPGALFLAQR
jgi:hypothetical protein